MLYNIILNLVAQGTLGVSLFCAKAPKLCIFINTPLNLVQSKNYGNTNKNLRQKTQEERKKKMQTNNLGLKKQKNLEEHYCKPAGFFLNVSSHRFISIFHGWPARSLNDYESTFTFCLIFFPFFVWFF